MNTIFAYKSGMSMAFTESGDQKGVTVLAVAPTTVDSLRTKEKHGYNAIRVKFKDVRFGKKFHFREIRTDEQVEAGSEVKLADVLQAGDTVQLTGTSRGLGFTGVVKRHHFKGGPRTHGTSDRERAPGSSGTNMTPGRVFKGKRRAGHKGVDTITMKRVKVLAVDNEKQTITVIGPVPGRKKSEVLRLTKI